MDFRKSITILSITLSAFIFSNLHPMLRIKQQLFTEQLKEMALKFINNETEPSIMASESERFLSNNSKIPQKRVINALACCISLLKDNNQNQIKVLLTKQAHEVEFIYPELAESLINLKNKLEKP